MAPNPSDETKPTEKAASLRSLRKKLEKLNRAPLPEPQGEAVRAQATSPQDPLAAGSSPPSIIYRRDLPRVAVPRVPEGGGICIPLGDLVAGREIPSCRGPSCYLVERSLSEAVPEASELSASLEQALDALARRGPPEGDEPLTIPVEHLCFLDIETTGLGSTPVFLIGTLVCRGGGLLCRQFLARTYAEEASILDQFVLQAREAPAFVTFNGKTFDVPYLRMRAAATGVLFHEPRHHFDLLHESRRAFRGKVPDCRLQTLERHVCGRHRGNDIPGPDIPRAYHDFVRTGDAREIARVVQHNQHDLMTMAHLMSKLVLAGKT